jgi:hypothetical protein
MTETNVNPNALLEEIRSGAARTFDKQELCYLLTQVLATPDYWDEDGYLVQLQFHRDEMRIIANFMSIGIGVSECDPSEPGDEGDSTDGPIPESPLGVFESAALGEYQGTLEHPGAPSQQLPTLEIEKACDTAPQAPPDN